MCEVCIGCLVRFRQEIMDAMDPYLEFILLSVLPVAFVVIFMLAFGVGVGTVPFSLLGVLLPPEVSSYDRRV